MMKYIYLILAIFCLFFFVYFFFANRLNRNLNIKKRQMAISPIKNKYTKLMFLSICLFFVFGMFFVYKVASHDYNELKKIDNAFDYQENLKLVDLNHIKIDNCIEYKESYKSLEDNNYVYLINENSLIKYDIIAKRSTKLLISEEYKIYSIYQNNNYVVCISSNNKNSRLDIVSKYDLSVKNTIIIDGEIKASIINNDEINLIIYNKALKESFKNGYRQNKNEKEYFDELMYIDCCNFDTILTHLKVKFDGFEIHDLSFCVIDEFFVFNQDLYIIFNSFNEDICNNKFYIIKYSYQEMEILNYRSYNGCIYSSPIIVNEKLVVISKDITNNTYKRMLVDKYLNVLENQAIELLKINQFNNIIIDNTVISNENVLIYNNKYLLSYKYDNNFIYFDEYLIDMNAHFEYKILINKSFDELNILSCFKENNKIVFSYKIDNNYGYFYLDIINEKYGVLEVFDNNICYITLNNIVVLENNNYKMK